MNCQEIQPALSEYIERSLDPIRMKAVETHLSSCVACRAEAESLVDCIQQVAQLPILDPPLGFAQRVMAHVYEMEAKPSRWKRIFRGLKISAPVQAAAVILVAALALTLYQKESQIRNSDLVQRPTIPVSPAPLSLKNTARVPAKQSIDSASASSNEIKHENSKPEPVQLGKTNPQSFSSKSKTAVTTQSSEIAAAQNSAGDIKNPLIRRGPIQAQEVATGIEGFGSSGDAFGNAPKLGGPFQPGFFVPEHVLSPISEPIADVEFVVRRRTNRGSNENVAGNDSSGQPQEGDIAPASTTAEQSNSSSSVAVREVRWFAVPADRYKQFRKELVSEANIESEKTIGATERDFAPRSNRELLIKVVIVSPAER